jgi:hypothetical protein
MVTFFPIEPCQSPFQNKSQHMPSFASDNPQVSSSFDYVSGGAFCDGW